MTSKKKMPSRILDSIHDTASDLHASGFINMKRMRQYDALCLDPIPQFTSDKIRSLRARNKLSQAVFASVLNTSLSTVRQWEGGKNIQAAHHLNYSVCLIEKDWTC